VSINAIKRQLDEQVLLAEQLQAERMAQAAAGAAGAEAAMMGPEELAAVQQVQELKAAYRDQFNELQMLKSEAAYTQQLVEQCSQQLLLEFGEWCAAQGSLGAAAQGLLGAGLARRSASAAAAAAAAQVPGRARGGAAAGGQRPWHAA
jgi:hypothetical protein